MKATSKAEEVAEKFLEKRRLKVRLSSQASMEGIATQLTSPSHDRQANIRDRQVLMDEIKEKTKKGKGCTIIVRISIMFSLSLQIWGIKTLKCGRFQFIILGIASQYCTN